MSVRDPRDVAIDALVQTRNALARSLETVNARIAELKAGEKLSDPRKHKCERCGVRFYRVDQLADHRSLVHQEAA